MLFDKIIEWNNLYSIPGPQQIRAVFMVHEAGGIGDAISTLPAFRHLKKMYPKDLVVLVTYPDHYHLFKRCKYIDRFLSINHYKSPDSALMAPNAIRINADDASFEDHHKDHIIKSNIRRICRTEDMSDVNFDYDIEVYNTENKKIWIHQHNLKGMANGKPIVGISPAFTMFSRIWQSEYWERLTDLLQKDGKFVVSFGHKQDLIVRNVDFDGRGQFDICHIPDILDMLDAIFVLNSGMMHIAAINKKIHMVLISVGQFPPEVILPYRNGVCGHNTTVVNHSCSIKDQCLRNHLNESSIRNQQSMFLQQWIEETGQQFSERQLLLKYTCWNYCEKDTNKYECSRMITPEMVFEAFKKNEHCRLDDG